jgi:hypothetical protein
MLALVAAGAAALVLWRAPAPPRGPGVIEGAARATASPRGDAGILFGDLHVHTTWSIDAFVYALPLFGGEGVHPPADACDYARHCAALDFYAITDHAEGLFPERWRETLESVRQCNARASDPADPDLVAFAGWEWTQQGFTPETHYGHRNVILLGERDEELPPRPITSLPQGTVRRARGVAALDAIAALGPLGLGRYADLAWHLARIATLPDCPPDAEPRDASLRCRENAETPAALFAKLARWGGPALVIPHGLAWGVHAPPGASLAHSLAGGNHDPSRERLLEVFSGHGSSEEYRASADAAQSAPLCPAPTAEYLPCCWRAGELVRARCGDLPPAECDARVAEAQRLALEAGTHPERVLPGTTPEDWLDCDQCRDCFKPALSLRPRETAQAALALRDPGAPAGAPDRFRFGFVASSDDHSARAGAGYKQTSPEAVTDARGFASPRVEAWTNRLLRGAPGDGARAVPAPPDRERGFGQLFDVERGASFFYGAGLVAVHARGRDRRAIWDALVRREVYGTSGPRILLWFDLVNAPGTGAAPMGSEVAMRETPRFRVRAAGSLVQRPGCPAETERALSPARVASLCGGECWNPSDARVPIAAIEVVRVRPQRAADEPIAALVEDPWRRFACPPDPAGCEIAFDDPEFAAAGRDAVYYVRALQEPTPAINGAGLRTRFDASGAAQAVSPCPVGWRAEDRSGDCLAPAAERAWSSPIYVDFVPRGADASGR